VGFEVREPGKAYSGAGIVIDNSVAMRWLVASGKPADQRYALAVRTHVREQESRVVVPYLWTYEAANVAAYYVRRGELEYSVAIHALHAFNDVFSISIDRGETPQALFEAAELHAISAYDASYLLLARNEGLPLATLDKKMRKSAKRMGIPVFGAQ
jgi:predicted nucleic acid-binding protein